MGRAESHADTTEATQLILELYQTFGVGFLHELNGCFACAIWDSTEDKLILISDRYGMRPLYYAQCGHRFLFSSEIKGLLVDPMLPRQVSAIAVQEFFRYQFLLDDKTLLSDVRVLPPASLLELTNGQWQRRRYWSPRFDQENVRGVRAHDYVEELIRLFRQATARQTALEREQSKPVALFLSGGLDSRTTLGFIREADVPTHCYTFGVPNCRDHAIAQEAARVTDSCYHFHPLTAVGLAKDARHSVYITDGLIGCTHLYAPSLLPEVRKRSSISFTGFAGDLLLGGSYLSKETLGLSDDERLADALQDKASIILPEQRRAALLRPAYYPLAPAGSMEPFREFLDWTPATRPGDKSDHFFLYQHVRRFTLQGLIMQRSQIEYRTPFFDNDLFDFICLIPPRLRMGHRVYIEMLRQAFPVLAHLPYQKTGLPADAPAWRIQARGAMDRGARGATRLAVRLGLPRLRLRFREQGFHHYASWLRTTLHPFVEDTLFSEPALSRPYFQPAMLREVVNEHMSGRRDRTPLISKLLTFELWHQLFLD
jgi:asparagine synthase (glutamine-hydrolysing)